MAISSALTHRRLTNSRQAETTHQVIAFRLRQEWFALPIYLVQKVIPLSKVYGDLEGAGVSLTLYQGKELLVVDVGYRIFKRAPSQELSQSSSASTAQNQDEALQRYLVIVESPQGELVGLPIDSPPKLHRVPESAFAPLPDAYLSEANIQCVSSLLIQGKEQPPLFLLNLEQLLRSPGFIPQLKPAPQSELVN